MHKLIKKKRLEKMGFGDVTSKSRTRGNEFRLGEFHVVIFEDDEENPQVSMIIHNTRVMFPGAYTMKDLKDLMFMYYGEEAYSKMFPNEKIKIADTVFTKEAVMEAYDAGHHSALPHSENHDLTSEAWYKKKYGNK